MMKKLLLLFIITVAACSSDDDSNNKNDKLEYFIVGKVNCPQNINDPVILMNYCVSEESERAVREQLNNSTSEINCDEFSFEDIDGNEITTMVHETGSGIDGCSGF